jgi:hypothetical protein
MTFVLGIIIGYMFGCWLALNNIEGNWDKVYYDICKCRKNIVIELVRKTAVFTDWFGGLIIRQLRKVYIKIETKWEERKKNNNTTGENKLS